MPDLQDSLLGREVAYPSHYDPALLFPIARATGREQLGIANAAALPFIGHDRWHAYELSWLDARGKPQAATATFTVPCDSAQLIESKSLKLYLNSLNAHRFDSEAEALRTIARDLSAVAGAEVAVRTGLPAMDAARQAKASMRWTSTSIGTARPTPRCCRPTARWWKKPCPRSCSSPTVR